MIARVIKIHSDFYYVKADDIIFECKIREKLKKEKIEVYVGDKVRIEELNYETTQAVIFNIEKRENFIPRPSIANIDQIIVVASLDQPEFDFTQMDSIPCKCRIL